MSRSNNTRRKTRGHSKRHSSCGDRSCPWCIRNFRAAANRQPQFYFDPIEDQTRRDDAAIKAFLKTGV